MTLILTRISVPTLFLQLSADLYTMIPCPIILCFYHLKKSFTLSPPEGKLLEGRGLPLIYFCVSRT